MDLTRNWFEILHSFFRSCIDSSVNRVSMFLLSVAAIFMGEKGQSKLVQKKRIKSPNEL